MSFIALLLPGSAGGTLDTIPEVDNRIILLEHHLSSSSRSHPLRTHWLRDLATARFARYGLSGQKSDLDKHILHLTEVALLPFPSFGLYVNIFGVLHDLAEALFTRFHKFSKRPEDLKSSIDFLRHARKLPLEAFEVSRTRVAETLVLALNFYPTSDVEDATRHIKEIMAICRELLVSHSPGHYPVNSLVVLSISVSTEYHRSGHVEPLDEVIEFLRGVVVTNPPGSSQVSLALGRVLGVRIAQAATCDDDIEEALALLDTVVAAVDPGDSHMLTLVHAQALTLISGFASLRTYDNRSAESLEKVISLCRSCLSRNTLNSSTMGDRGRSLVVMLLEACLKIRFQYFGLTESLQEASSCSSEIDTLLPSQDPLIMSFYESATEKGAYSTEELEEKIRYLQGLAVQGTNERWAYAKGLGNWYRKKFHQTGDMMDLEECLKYHRMALAPGSTGGRSASYSCLELGDLLLVAFDRSSTIEHLEESILMHRRTLELHGSRGSTFEVHHRLSLSLYFCWLLLGRVQDLDESMRFFDMAVGNEYATPHHRLDIAYKWAASSRVSGHHSILTAYQKALSLVQTSLVVAPTIQTQHYRLVATTRMPQVPLEYASYLIGMGQLEQAIETLEQGRALLWSEMRGLRTSVDQLRNVDSALANKFAKINRSLEALTTSNSYSQSVPASSSMDERRADDREGTDAFGRTLNEQRRLVEERDTLISQVRQLPGFESFLGTPSFNTLRDAASRGPVIIINHCRWRSDILILLCDAPPSLVSTPDDFYARVNKLRTNLLDTRKTYSTSSCQYDEALRSVLNDLYTLVGQPVVSRLRKLDIPEQSRVWWCPTSTLCSLPLHAMGPIPSDDGKERYFSDLYVTSYTPTLSALIKSRGSGALTPDRPSLLLVGRPTDNLPEASEEITVIQRILGESAHCLVSEDATLQAVMKGLQDHKFAHFACHGNLVPGRPFDAWFRLEGQDRLTLLDIVRSHLPNAEFAFLSVCHAAELTDESVADEALHLTAAMQYCGFRSVVGTMWAMVDEDGPEVAKHFYKLMFSSEGGKVPSYMRSARALRNAVQRLRKKRGMTLERWVNYVHYGA
ncbi:CHAT domain-containing protein [Lactifluus subvellereus]|nr:CHAT domain-containing protein [Lactifluus subvellereus]